MNDPAPDKTTLDLLEDLIRIDSTNPQLVSGGKGESDIAGYIYNYLGGLTSRVEKQIVSENRWNVIARIRGREKGKTLLLNGHMDTVGTECMSIPALRPEQKNGRMYGRGSADMKAGLAAMMAACRSCLKQQTIRRGEVIFSFVVDEEYKSTGTERLLNSVSADAAVVCEPTDLKIGLAHKGFTWAAIEVPGKAAHGSRPAEGIDAILKTAPLLQELDTLGNHIQKHNKHHLLGSASLHASFIEGGQELSSYPAHCTVTLERRTLPGEPADIFQKEITAVIDKIVRRDPDFKARLRILFSRPAQDLAASEPIAVCLGEAFQAVCGAPAQYGGISWWMDTALITRAGIPAIAFGPAGFGLHGACESVDVGTVATTADVLVETIDRFCNQTV